MEQVTHFLLESQHEAGYDIECAADYSEAMRELMYETCVFGGSYEECLAAYARFMAQLSGAVEEEMVA